VVHSVDDEVDMARLCEELWPGERISETRREVEAEYASRPADNPIVEQYVKHLPEVGPEIMNEPGLHHVVFRHEDWCGIFKGQRCNCSPGVKFYAEPNRS
jgi:hypothetical protein